MFRNKCVISHHKSLFILIILSKPTEICLGNLVLGPAWLWKLTYFTNIISGRVKLRYDTREPNIVFILACNKGSTKHKPISRNKRHIDTDAFCIAAFIRYVGPMWTTPVAGMVVFLGKYLHCQSTKNTNCVIWIFVWKKHARKLNS